MIEACRRGNLKKVQQLYSQGVNLHIDDDKAFRVSCENGQLIIAQWLYAMSANIHSRHDEAFRLACQNGHLKVVQWLHHVGIDLSTCGEIALRTACLHGQMSVAKWLYSMGVNIRANDDAAFRSACQGGHLAIARWLQRLGADIHAKHDWAFHVACQFNHFSLARWLWSFGVNLETINADAEIDHRKRTNLKWLRSVGCGVEQYLMSEAEKQQLSPRTVCSICLSEMELDVALVKVVCDHVFHAECLIDWLHHGGHNCPQCRMVIKNPPYVNPFVRTMNSLVEKVRLGLQEMSSSLFGL